MPAMGIFFWLSVLGLIPAILALVLRQQEVAHPAPGDIQAKGGLGHMLVGALAGLAFLSISIAAVFAGGVLLPIFAALVLYFCLRRVNFDGALHPLYRLQVPLAVVALFFALVLWINIIILIQGASNV
ncbi:MAG: hypothetical protein AAGB10_20065 [Pseudomonadota bacterium]